MLYWNWNVYDVLESNQRRIKIIRCGRRRFGMLIGRWGINYARCDSTIYKGFGLLFRIFPRSCLCIYTAFDSPPCSPAPILPTANNHSADPAPMNARDMDARISYDSSEGTLHHTTSCDGEVKQPQAPLSLSDQQQQRPHACDSLPLHANFHGAHELGHMRRDPFGRLQHACLNLSPSVFSLNMGTGMVSILLHGLPYNAEWLRAISIVIFVLNIVLFVIFLIGTVVRLVLWRGIFTALNRHLMAGMYWGCLPMGLATIVVSFDSLAPVPY